MDPKLQLILDTPIYSKRSLGTNTQVRFFDAAGVNADDNIDVANQIDMNSDFKCFYIESNLLPTAGTAFDATLMTLAASLIKNTWLNFLKNTTDKAWQTSLSSLIKVPVLLAAAGASAYNPLGTVNGGTKLNVPLTIFGGQNINVTQNRTNATDYSTLTTELVLWGIIDRSKTVK